MKATQQLPAGYAQTLHIDLQHDKKSALIVNLSGLVVALIMCLWMHTRVPVTTLLDRDAGMGLWLARMLVLCVGFLAYIILHELTHAAVMRAVGGGKVRFGFTGMYAYAGSETDYFDKIAYRCIALAPVVVWGVIFGVLQAVVPVSWCWVVWLLQIGNVSGAAGDIYVTLRLWPMSPSLLVRDTGVAMWVFERTEDTARS